MLIDKANVELVVSRLPPQGESSNSMQVLAKALRRDNPVVHVNVEGKLKEHALDLLPRACWPKASLTDHIATEMSKAASKGIANAFVYVDIAKFLPFWAETSSSRLDSSDEEEEPCKYVRELAKAMGAKDKPK